MTQPDEEALKEAIRILEEGEAKLPPPIYWFITLEEAALKLGMTEDELKAFMEELKDEQRNTKETESKEPPG